MTACMYYPSPASHHFLFTQNHLQTLDYVILPQFFLFAVFTKFTPYFSHLISSLINQRLVAVSLSLTINTSVDNSWSDFQSDHELGQCEAIYQNRAYVGLAHFRVLWCRDEKVHFWFSISHKSLHNFLCISSKLGLSYHGIVFKMTFDSKTVLNESLVLNIWVNFSRLILAQV